MKIKILKHQKYKLLELNFLKSTKVTKKNDSCFVSLLTDSFVHNKVGRLKSALKIIYKYHVSDYKILFLGVPCKNVRFLKRLGDRTGHYFIPQSVNLKDIRQNINTLTRILQKKRLNISTRELSVKKENTQEKPKLVVFMNNSINKSLLEEVCKKRIPFIDLNTKMRWLLENEQETSINSSNLSIKHKTIWPLIVFSILSKVSSRLFWAKFRKMNIKNKTKTKYSK